MEPVKDISASWSPQPASSAHTLTFITISRLIDTFLLQTGLPQDLQHPQFHSTTGASSLFPPQCPLPPSPLLTSPLSLPSSSFVPLTFGQCPSSDTDTSLSPIWDSTQRFPIPQPEDRNGCGWGNKCAVAMEAAIMEMDTMRKGGCRTAGLTSEWTGEQLELQRRQSRYNHETQPLRRQLKWQSGWRRRKPWLWSS